jgi:uracil-DNA glycosylase
MLYQYKPKSLKVPAACKERAGMLSLPHMLPLRDFVEFLRNEMGPEYEIPHFDPLDGGINAQVLFLLEAPGSKAVASGFVSRNNPDETAKNFFELNIAAGLDRAATVCWNIVPWYIGTGTKIRAAHHDEIRQAREGLERLLALLPRIRVIALVGKKAASIESEILQMLPGVKVFTTPHPSPLFVNRLPENRALLLDALTCISDELKALGSSVFEPDRQTYQKPQKHSVCQPSKNVDMTNHNISEGVRKSWEDPSVRERRQQRHGVSVLRNCTPIGEFSSLYQAFKDLGLPVEKHIPFRNKLKLAGSLAYNDGKDIYAFSLIPPFKPA